MEPNSPPDLSNKELEFNPPDMKPRFTLHLLSDGTVNPGVLRIPFPNSILQVILPSGSSFHHPETTLISNIPFKSKKIQKVKRFPGPYSLLWDLYFELNITMSGPFYLYFRSGVDNSRSPHVYFTVDPILYINKNVIPISSLIVQTNFARCIGTVDHWVENLQVISQLGYNMIHLPPIQLLGGRSLYSIADFNQLSPSIFSADVSESQRWPLLQSTVTEIERKLGLVFMIDVVLNHINSFCPIIVHNPDLAYNLNNSPHLRPAFYVDNLISKFSLDISDRKTEIDPEHPDCDQIAKILRERLYASSFPKYYTLNKERCLKLFKSTSFSLPPQPRDKNVVKENLQQIFPGPDEVTRATLQDFTKEEKQQWFSDYCIIEEKKNFQKILFDTKFAHLLFDDNEEEFLAALDFANLPRFQHLDSIINDIVKNTIKLFQENYHSISPSYPIVWRYFSVSPEVPVACNGFLMEGKPTDDFMLPTSEAFVRRQVNIWGDCAKLRYGKSPSDNPPLWRMMEDYISSCASIAAALRIDNAHSTPIEVAEYMLAAARRVNPNIFVMAELFTDDQTGFNYINRIGINAFMKEGHYGRDVWAMDSILQHCGGHPLVPIDSLNHNSEIIPQRSIPGVLFDLTHDNMDIKFDHGLVSAGCSMAAAPVASTRGYDDILEWNPHCAREFRLYPLSLNFPAFQLIRHALNTLHLEMGDLQMNEISTYVYGPVLSIFRHNSDSGEGRFMILNFGNNDQNNDQGNDQNNDQNNGDGKRRIPVPDEVVGFCFEAKIEEVHYNSEVCTSELIVPSDVKFYLEFNNPTKCHYEAESKSLVLDNFDIGTFSVFKTGISHETIQALQYLQTEDIIDKLMKAIMNERPDFIKIATLLYSCETEEQDARNSGTYGFPSYQCFYAGISGIKKAIDSAIDMTSPVFSNIKQGDWLMNFILSRMEKLDYTFLLTQTREFFDIIKKLPNMYKPRYVCRVISILDMALKQHAISKFSYNVQGHNELIQDLAIASLQFFVPVPSAPLISKDIFDKYFSQEGIAQQIKAPELSMAAGLPHFSTSWCRSWGRDTFISLRGLLLIPGRFKIAKSHLIAFASVEKYGLIPNLMSGACNPRYNSRDATWFFLQALQDYHSFVSMRKQQILSNQNSDDDDDDDQNDHLAYLKSLREDEDEKEILNENIFDWMVPSVGSENGELRTMGAIIQEIMQCHATGINFRDDGADDIITEEGRMINIWTDWSTGFIYGGNQYNCGTWMDKMGSSSEAGNRGIPATPRNGAAVEINGLLASTLRWLVKVHNDHEFGFEGVKEKTYNDWYQLLLRNFQRSYWNASRGYYRDTIGASNPESDLQLRPNFVIPMAIIPELFEKNPKHVQKALRILTQQLLGKIGLRTLSPNDPSYRPNYCSSDKGDYFTADGFNYHNGPAWVWPVGYYCRAMLNFFKRDELGPVMNIIANLRGELKRNDALGIEELTNEDGSICKDGCVTQAWSIATIIDFLYDFNASFVNDES